MNRKLALCGVGVIAAFQLWISLASALYLWWVGHLSWLAFPFWQWFDAAPYIAENKGMLAEVLFSGMIPAAAIIAPTNMAIFGRRRTKLKPTLSGDLQPIERGKTKTFGDSDWATMEESLKMFPGPSAEYGGIVLGEAYRVDLDSVADVDFDPNDQSTWGQGGKAPLLIEPCTHRAGHGLMFAPSGMYKTVCAATTLFHWRGGSVVIDVKAELGPMLKRTMEQDHGKRVYFLNPKLPYGINALDCLDPNSYQLEEDIQGVVSRIFGGSKEDADDKFFVPWAKDLCCCLIADMITNPDFAAPKTLASFRAAITMPDPQIRDVLRGIYHNSNSLYARDIAGNLMDAVDRQFNGITGTAGKSTSWLSIPSLGDLVSGDTFRTDDITTGDISVFIQIPQDTMKHIPGPARVIIGSLLKAILRAEGRIYGKVLFQIDEADTLRYMEVIEDARDRMRSSGAVLFLMYQTVAQLEEQWGKVGKAKWYANTSYRIYSGVREISTAEDLEKECGHYGALVYSEGDNSSSQGQVFSIINTSRSQGRNTNVQENRIPVCYAYQFMQEFREDDCVIVGTGKRAIRCGRPIYFRRPELLAKIDTSRYVKPRRDNGPTEPSERAAA